MTQSPNTVQNLEKGRISALQLGFLAVTFVIATADVFLPAFVAQEAQQDSWLSVIIGMASSFVIVMIFLTLALRYPGKTIIEYSCDILGKPLGKLAGLVFIYYFFDIATAVTRELGEIFVISFNPESPILVYALITILVSAYAVSKGLEVIVRVNEFILPVGMGILGLIAVINISATDLNNFLPVLANGILPPLKGGILIQAWMIQTVILLQFIPYVKDKNKVRKSLSISILVLGMGMELGVLTVAVFGKLTGELLFPALEYVRYASIGEYIQNLDITIMGVWIIGIFIKITVAYYALVLSISQWSGLKTVKPIILPVGILIAVISVTAAERINSVYNFAHYTLPFLSFTAAFVLPVILLTVSLIKGKPAGEK